MQLNTLLSDNDRIYEDASAVKGYVTDILARAASERQRDGGGEDDVTLAPSSLEQAVNACSSAPTRTMWADMKQVNNQDHDNCLNMIVCQTHKVI